jgi:hypothetical protein
MREHRKGPTPGVCRWKTERKDFKETLAHERGRLTEQ